MKQLGKQEKECTLGCTRAKQATIWRDGGPVRGVFNES